MSIKDGILDVTVKKHWFNEIKSGRKTHEYRDIESWEHKLGRDKKNKYHTLRIRAGMLVKSSDTNNVLYGKILSITEKYGLETDLKIDSRVYDIEFELIKTGKADENGNFKTNNTAASDI